MGNPEWEYSLILAPLRPYPGTSQALSWHLSGLILAPLRPYPGTSQALSWHLTGRILAPLGPYPGTSQALSAFLSLYRHVSLINTFSLFSIYSIYQYIHLVLFCIYAYMTLQDDTVTQTEGSYETVPPPAG
ncbi:hypothetical protein FKM82_029290 [Ascaphus truei]